MKLMLLIGGVAFLLLGLVLCLAAIVVFAMARKRSAKVAGTAPSRASAPATQPSPVPQNSGLPVPPPAAQYGSDASALPQMDPHVPPPMEPFVPVTEPSPPPPMPTSGEPTFIGESTIALPLPGHHWGQLNGVSGAVAGRSFPITMDGFYIGRDGSAAQVVIADGSVSKRHVWVGVHDGEVVAIDEGSTNGTYVNSIGARIQRQPLSPGDTLIISNDIARLVYQR